MAPIKLSGLHHPYDSLHRLSRLPELVSGAVVARHWPASDRLPGSPSPGRQALPNPLRTDFEAIGRGPGVLKWMHYLEPCYRHLQKFVGREVVVVEVGVYSGGSLRTWRRYSGDRCQIHGVDIPIRMQSVRRRSYDRSHRKPGRHRIGSRVSIPGRNRENEGSGGGGSLGARGTE